MIHLINEAIHLATRLAEEKRRAQLMKISAEQLRAGLQRVEDGKYDEITVPAQEAAPDNWDSWFD